MESELLRMVVDALNMAGIDHMVTGSFASTYHGEPRMTRDIDMVIDSSVDAVEVFVQQFPVDRFYVNDAVSAVERRDMFNVLDTVTGWKVDLIVRKERAFSRSEFDRRQFAVIAGVQTHVTSVEDAILSKLEWQATSASDTQRRDVVEMLKVNMDALDLVYLTRWATELGVSEVLVELTAVAETGA